MKDFYEKTTKAFNITVLVDSQKVDLTNNVVTVMFKTDKSIPDEEASINVNAFELTTEGVAKFILTPDDTAIAPGVYYYEFKWTDGINEYVLESDTVRVLDRVFD